MIAVNYMEHVELGLKKVPMFVHIPLQIIISVIFICYCYNSQKDTFIGGYFKRLAVINI